MSRRKKRCKAPTGCPLGSSTELDFGGGNGLGLLCAEDHSSGDIGKLPQDFACCLSARYAIPPVKRSARFGKSARIASPDGTGGRRTSCTGRDGSPGAWPDLWGGVPA